MSKGRENETGAEGIQNSATKRLGIHGQTKNKTEKLEVVTVL